MVKILVEVLFILALATKEVKQGKTSELIFGERQSFLAYNSSERFLKKLTGRTDIEDALRKLDKLTQDEVLMVAAQGLRATQGVGTSVQAVDDKITTVVRGARSYPLDHLCTLTMDLFIWLDGEKTMGAIQGLATDLSNLNRSLSCIPAIGCRDSNTLSGNQLRQDLRKWLDPPDPSVNQNAASAAHHKGTATWFTEGSTFENWKVSGSLLWVHGKRTSSRPVSSGHR